MNIFAKALVTSVILMILLVLVTVAFFM